MLGWRISAIISGFYHLDHNCWKINWKIYSHCGNNLPLSFSDSRLSIGGSVQAAGVCYVVAGKCNHVSGRDLRNIANG
jgi:hypothetical protein